MKHDKIDILKKHMKGIGGIEGLKTFFFVVGHRVIGDKVISIKKKQLGFNKFYLRTNTCDIDLANTMLAKRGGDYNFLLPNDVLKNANVIIDAGANIGFFSRLCRNVNQKSEIIAIELEPGNYEILKKNTDCVQGVTGIKTINRGLWNKSTRLRIIERETGTLGFMAEEVDNNTLEYDVDAISVPDIISIYHLDKIDIFKIDIEGSEFYLFDESCDEWIDRVGMFIIELHDRIIPGCEERVFGVMKRYGFMYVKYGENYVFTRNMDLKNFIGMKR